jgi:hypothetical protein
MRLRQLPDSPPPGVPEIEIRAGEDALSLSFRVEAPRETLLKLPSLDDRVFQPVRATVDGIDAPLLSKDGSHMVLVPQGLSQVVLEGRLNATGTVSVTFDPGFRPLKARLTGDLWDLRGADPQGLLIGSTLLLTRRPQAAGEATPPPPPPRGEAQASAGVLPGGPPNIVRPFFKVTRTISLGLELKVLTRVEPLSHVEAPFSMSVPLLKGESPTTGGLSLRDGAVLLTLSPLAQVTAWESRLKLTGGNSLELEASRGPYSEAWILDAATLWRVETDGIPPILSMSEQGYWNPEWRPAPGERLRLAVSRPEPVKGGYLIVDRARLAVQVGRESRRLTLELSLRTSQGGNFSFRLPQGASVEELKLDGLPLPFAGGVPADGGGPFVTAPLNPGERQLTAEFTMQDPVSFLTRFPAIDPGVTVANIEASADLPTDRWTLFAGGPVNGPAVLFWSHLGAFLVFSFLLSRTGLTPLRTASWLLFFLGISQYSAFSSFFCAAWLLALGLRKGRLSDVKGPWRFNMLQILLVLWTAAALFLIYRGLTHGLLEGPNMSVTGNGSSDHSLRWFLDRSDGPLPRPWAVTLPGYAYRVLMLLWALWMAVSLLRWFRWGWHAFSSTALWKRSPAAPREFRVTPAQRMAMERERQQRGGFGQQGPGGGWQVQGWDPGPQAPQGPDGGGPSDQPGEGGPSGTPGGEGPGNP